MIDRDDEILIRRVPDGVEKCRLDVFLADQPEVQGRSEARRMIEGGSVRVSVRKPPKPGLVLAAGDEVRFMLPVLPVLPVLPALPALPALPGPPAPGPGGARAAGAAGAAGAAADAPVEVVHRLRVLYEDPYILVIDKAPGLAAHRPENPRASVQNVSDLALAHCPGLTRASGEDRPGIVHRLDRDTSGVMVLAKTDEACHFLKSQFKARTVAKEYRAIAFGEARFDSDYVDSAIAPHPRHHDRMTAVSEGGKSASTFYQVVQQFRGFTHFRCLPKTGRTHQIRVHLTSIGHALVGDRMYRPRSSAARLPDGAPDPGRQCLHAQRLGFKHPFTHEDLVFDAPIPDDMQVLLEWLTEHRPR